MQLPLCTGSGQPCGEERLKKSRTVFQSFYFLGHHRVIGSLCSAGGRGKWGACLEANRGWKRRPAHPAVQVPLFCAEHQLRAHSRCASPWPSGQTEHQDWSSLAMSILDSARLPPYADCGSQKYSPRMVGLR